MMLDWLAAGLDPKKSILFVQSHVPEVMELHTLLSMVTPLSWLLRVPTFKEKVKLQPHNVNYGLVGYPVLMTADIVLYKAEVVPVGEDQLPHLELARHPEICNIYRLQRYFNPLQLDDIAEQCRSAKIGCVDCKMLLAREINSTLKPFREQRAALAARPKYVASVLADGAQRAQVIARETLREVKLKMGLI
jgi:tryptophanyl-tRNA synthetase